MNTGISAFDVGENIAVLRSNAVVTIMTYEENYSSGDITSFISCTELKVTIKKRFGGNQCNINFMPVCMRGNWGFFV